MRRAQQAILIGGFALAAALAFAGFASRDAAAHGDTTAVIDLSSGVDGDRRLVRLRAQLSLEHWLVLHESAEAEAEAAPLDAAAFAEREAELRALPEAELGAAFDAVKPAFLADITLELEGAPVALAIVAVETPRTDGVDFPRYSMVTLEGGGAASAASATIAWASVDGFVVRDGPWDMRALHRTRFAHFVGRGVQSPAMPLDGHDGDAERSSFAVAGDWSVLALGAAIAAGLLGLAYAYGRRLS